MAKTTTQADADTMEIWKKVGVTDPDFTSRLTFGSKLTAIDAMYTIMRATELWGPVGKGWSYSVEYRIEQVSGGTEEPARETQDETGNPIKVPGKGLTTTVTLVMAFVTIHWGPAYDVINNAKVFPYSYGPVMATNELIGARGRVDEDAGKKAMTDALTKALSHLGFSADVFLGMFDDSKYVDQLKREKEARKISDKLPESVQALIAKIAAARSIDELDKLREANREFVKQQNKPIIDLLAIRVREQTERLKAGPPFDPAERRDGQVET